MLTILQEGAHLWWDYPHKLLFVTYRLREGLIFLNAFTLIVNYLVGFADFVWAYILPIFLTLAGLYLTYKLDFYQFRYIKYIVKNTFGAMFQSSDEGDGDISNFKAAVSAMASSIGAANIVGVPVAIAIGGPGAIFWMWIIALFGMAIKFCEIVLGIKYRQRNENGEFVGGPMYYLAHTKWPWLASIFAFSLLIFLAPSISTQAQTVAQNAEILGFDRVWFMIIFTTVVTIIIFGGLQSIANVTEVLVPLMGATFILSAILVSALNYQAIPEALSLIFTGAFTGTSAMGGFAGSGIALVLRQGMARGLYSNESGMGTTPIAHAAATVDTPAQQGIWAVFEVTIDTLVVCTVTAFAVLTTGVWTEISASQAAQMPARAFEVTLGSTFGSGLVAVSLILFVFSTLIVGLYFGEKQAEYLFGSTKAALVARIGYLACVLIGAFVNLETIFSLMDFMLTFVVVPNVIGLLLLANESKELKDDLFNNLPL